MRVMSVNPGVGGFANEQNHGDGTTAVITTAEDGGNDLDAGSDADGEGDDDGVSNPLHTCGSGANDTANGGCTAEVALLAHQLDIGDEELRAQLPRISVGEKQSVKKNAPAASGWMRGTGNHGFYKRRQHAFSRVGWRTFPAVNRFQPLLSRTFSR
jgi:hypothetical protein